MKKRVFVAINFPENIKKSVAEIIKKLESLEPDAKWINPRNAHITLAFLGLISQEEIARITAILKLLAKNQEKFDLSLENIGFFPSLNMPRIIWLGAGENLNLLNLENNLKKQLEMNDFKTDNRLFTPHLTIGKAKREIKNIQKIINLSKKISLRKFLVTSIDVMESELRESGAEHKILFKVNLKNS